MKSPATSRWLSCCFFILFMLLECSPSVRSLLKRPWEYGLNFLLVLVINNLDSVNQGWKIHPLLWTDIMVRVMHLEVMILSLRKYLITIL